MKLKDFFLSLLIFCSILLNFQGVVASSSSNVKTIKIGVILDLSSRMGKEQETAIRIAIDDFNSTNFMIHTDFIDYNQSVLQNAIAAEELVKEKRVEVIILGINSWETTSLIAQIGAQSQVPIISLASSPPITSSFPSLQWPYLVQLSHNATQQVKNIASIIKRFRWRRVIVVYEDITGSSGTITLLTEALQNIGTEIEHHIVLPPLLSTTKNNRRDAIKKEMRLVDDKFYSRVFVVLKISLPYVSPLFEEAKERGLMRNDSVWITTEAITNFFPSFKNITMSSMDGVIGIMTKFDNSTYDFEVFEANFGSKFLAKYEREKYNEPSYQALLSYDAFNIIVKAKHSLVSNTRDNNTLKPKSFLEEILQRNFTGLSGQVCFNRDHSVAQNVRTKLVNIVGANYGDVLDFTIDDIEDNTRTNKLASEVNWPGNLKGDASPKGWKMPTVTKKMKIGVPIAHIYTDFIGYNGVKLNGSVFPRGRALDLIYNKNFTGYCIGIFDEVVKLLGYELHYQLIPFNSSYDDLVNCVHNKTFDAAVGDMTIMANRTKRVDFTLPFAESGLSIVLPAEESYDSDGPWIFLKPFTTKMWVVTFFIFVYTMIIIWVLEHGENSEFRGRWDNQLSTTTWFAFNSLYFAQREKISSKLARVVVILWFLIVLILTQSYTANLTSMITNERLNQSKIDVEMLQRTNVKVGYDNSSFVAKFLEELLKFNPNNVVGIDGKFEEFHQGFQDKKISAACLEYLYAKLFLTKYCNQYIMTQPSYRFGGFGFVFAKGSPIAVDVSEAILKLTEFKNGRVKALKKKFLNFRSECTSTTDGDEDDDANSEDDGQQSSLSLESFRFLFYMSVGTTTACLLASLIPMYNKYRQRVRTQQEIAPVGS